MFFIKSVEFFEVIKIKQIWKKRRHMTSRDRNLTKISENVSSLNIFTWYKNKFNGMN